MTAHCRKNCFWCVKVYDRLSPSLLLSRPVLFHSVLAFPTTSDRLNTSGLMFYCMWYRRCYRGTVRQHCQLVPKHLLNSLIYTSTEKRTREQLTICFAPLYCMGFVIVSRRHFTHFSVILQTQRFPSKSKLKSADESLTKKWSAASLLPNIC